MTREQLGTMLDLAAAGACARRIAARIGASTDAVAMACKRRGIALRPGSRAGDREWTPAEDARLQTLALGGFRGWEIARRMGRTKVQIQWRRQKLRRAGVWVEV